MDVCLCHLFSAVCSWEQWHLRVVVNNTPRPVSDDTAAVIERQRIQVSLQPSTDTLFFRVLFHLMHLNIDLAGYRIQRKAWFDRSLSRFSRLLETPLIMFHRSCMNLRSNVPKRLMIGKMFMRELPTCHRWSTWVTEGRSITNEENRTYAPNVDQNTTALKTIAMTGSWPRESKDSSFVSFRQSQVTIGLRCRFRPNRIQLCTKQTGCDIMLIVVLVDV